MATEIGRLIATFEADISKFEAGRKQVESGMQKTASSVNQSQQQIAKGELSMAQQLKAAESLQRQRSNALIAQWKQQERAARAAASGHKTFSQSLSDLSTSVATLQGPLGGISGRLSSLSSLFAGITGPAGAAVLAIGAVATAAIAAGTAIYRLASATAEATGKFKDLAQQTGFSVETLSTLANVAETSGGNIDTIAASLGIFQSNMVEAQDATSEMSRLFKQLTIDTKDNEKAFRQALEALKREANEENRVALARKLFGRSGREVLAVMKEMPGTLDQATDAMRGTSLITTDMAEKGDELADAIRRMGQVFGHATNVIGQEFGPDVKKVVEDVTRVIIDNKDVIRDWATAFADAARGAVKVADAVKDLGGVITGLGNLPIPTILRILGSVSGATGILSGLQSLGAAEPASTPFARNRPAFRRPNFSPFRPDQLGAPKRTGAGGAKAISEVADGWAKAAEVIQRAIDDIQSDIRRFTENMERVSASVSEAIFDQAYAIKALEANTPDWLQRAEEFIRAKTEEGYVWAEDTKQIYLNNAARLEQFRILQQGATRARTVAVGFEKGGMGLEDFSGGGGKLDRAGELREQYERHLERMRDLAFNLTSILDRAIFDGFEGGLKRGFQSLTLGILDLVKNVFLKQLENALANALSGVGSGGGKSLLANIGMAALGAIAGSFGGGGFSKGGISGGFGGKAYASGGTIPMGSWGTVHDNERVFATPFGAKVVPSSQGGSSPTIIINVPVRSAAAYSSPKSRRQLAEDISAALQGSLA